MVDVTEKKRRAKVRHIILFTISEAAVTRIGIELLQLDPEAMMKRISAAHAADQTQDAHDALLSRAEHLKIKPNENISSASISG